MWTKNVSGDDRSVVAAVLLVVGVVLYINKALGVTVTEVGLMRWAVVDHGLVDRVRRFVGEDACRQARDHFLHTRLKAVLENVVVDEDIVSLLEKICKNCTSSVSFHLL